MRDIKFCAYYKSKPEGKKWNETTPGIYSVAGLVWEEWYQSGFKSEGFKVNLILKNGNHLMCVANEVELIQYTGFKDKNGKEIYEGFILKCDDLIGWVVFKEEYGGFYLRVIKIDPNQWVNPPQIASDILFLELKLSDFEIIGDVYGNPEILGEGVHER